MKIENALALLKGRFRQLKSIGTVRLDLAVTNIMTACILHNICIMNGNDEFKEYIDIEEERRMEEDRESHNFGGNEVGMQNLTTNKRNNIVNILPIIIRE